MERSRDNGEGYESRLQGSVGADTGAISFGIWSICVSVTKMEEGRDKVGGLSSKSKKRELIVRDA